MVLRTPRMGMRTSSPGALGRRGGGARHIDGEGGVVWTAARCGAEARSMTSWSSRARGAAWTSVEDPGPSAGEGCAARPAKADVLSGDAPADARAGDRRRCRRPGRAR